MTHRPARRVTFVFPRIHYQTGDPPLGVAYLAAVLARERPDLVVDIVDGTFLGSAQRLRDRVATCGADVVGVFADSLVSGVAREVGQVARVAGAATLVGGPAASVDPETFVDVFDVVVTGEGEALIVELVDRLLAAGQLDDIPNLVLPDGDGSRHTERVARAPDLERLPWPAWELLDMERYVRLWPYLDAERIDARGTNVVGSRGCPWQCAYCQPALSTVFGRQVRRRRPASVVAEIEALQARYRIDGVFFHDDTITADHAWLTELCEELGRLRRPIRWGCNSRVDVLNETMIERMVDAGMRSVHLGIEAGSRRVRDEVLAKPIDVDHLTTILEQLRRRGAHSLGFFMLGSPTESIAEMAATVRLARSLPLSEATFSLTSALPGTHLYERLRGDDCVRFAPESSVDYYNQRNFTEPSGVREGVVRAMQLVGVAAFYLSPGRVRYLARHLASGRGRAKLAMKAARFVRPFLRLLD